MSLNKSLTHAFTLSLTILMFVIGSRIVFGKTNKSLTSVTLAPATLNCKIGGKCEVTITLKNISTNDIEVVRRNGEPFADYSFSLSQVSASKAQSNVLKAHARNNFNPPILKFSERVDTLSPGGSIEDIVDLSEYFNLSKIGTYKLHVTRTFAPETNIPPVTSNIISLQVVSR